jgi:hypothetical protein
MAPRLSDRSVSTSSQGRYRNIHTPPQASLAAQAQGYLPWATPISLRWHSAMRRRCISRFFYLIRFDPGPRFQRDSCRKVRRITSHKLTYSRDQSDTSKANDTTREYLDRGRPFTKRYNEDARDLDSLFYRPRRERESVSQMLARFESRPDESASNEEAPVSQPVYLVDQVTPVKVQDSETSPSIHSNLDSPMVRTEETLPSTPSSVSFRSGEPRHLGLYRNGLRADHHGLPLTELENESCPSYTPSFFTDSSDRASVRPPSHSSPEVISRRGFGDVVKERWDDTVSLFKSHAPTGTRGSLASRNDGHGIFETKMSRVGHRLKNGWRTHRTSLFGTTT